MFSYSKLKWIMGITLAAALITMGLMGGDWGKINSAETGSNANPVIISILPPQVPARSPDKVIVVVGLNFGDITNTRVRLVGNGVDSMLPPIEVVDNGISSVVTNTLMTETAVYTLTVVRSTYPSIPTIPLYPAWDRESNPLTFTVFQAQEIFLPLISIEP